MTSSAIQGYKSSVYYAVQPSITMTNEAMTDAGDHKTYTVTNSAHQAWDPTAATTVQTAPDGSTWTTVTTGFTINYALGQVLFASPVSGATPSVRVSGKYMTLAFFASVRTWEPNVVMGTADSTTLQSPPSAWKTFVATELTGTVKLSRFYLADGVVLGWLTAGSILLLQLYPGENANQRFQGYVILTQNDVKDMLGSLQTQDLTLTINGTWNYIGS